MYILEYYINQLKIIYLMDFRSRFKGRTAFMNKEGHIGVVLQTANPIDK